MVLPRAGRTLAAGAAGEPQTPPGVLLWLSYSHIHCWLSYLSEFTKILISVEIGQDSWHFPVTPARKHINQKFGSNRDNSDITNMNNGDSYSYNTKHDSSHVYEAFPVRSGPYVPKEESQGVNVTLSVFHR